jgi:hypothetical protein
VNTFGSTKLRALESRPVAQRNHKVERRIRDVLRHFSRSSLQINTDLFHDFNRERMSLSVLDPSAGHFKMLGIDGPQQRFRNWTLHTISGTQKQDSEFHKRLLLEGKEAYHRMSERRLQDLP